MATVDVVVPCYRYGHFLKQCVGSILTQSGPGVRALIIDDASPDETPEVAHQLAQQDSRVSYVRHSENRGHIATYNEGLDWATADYTLLLSADDWILPGALARAASLLDANPDIGFVYGHAIELTDGKELPSPRPPRQDATILSTEKFLRANRHYNPVATCTAVTRTSVQKRIGFYRPDLPHSGDMEMWMRFAAHGPVGRIEADQGVYRRHAANMSVGYYKDMLLDLIQRKAAIDIFLENATNLPNRDDMLQMLYRGLSESAILAAPLARGEQEQFHRIMSFAGRLDPAIRQTFAWKKQYLKKFLGSQFSSRVSLIKGKLRSNIVDH